MNTREKQAIVQIVAATDALFVPIRDWKSVNFAKHVLQRRASFESSGVPLLGASGVDASRREDSRVRSGLVRAKLLRLISRKGERSRNAKLSDRGDAMGRALCGLPLLHHAHPILQQIAALENHPDSAVGGWVREDRLCDVRYGETANPDERRKLVDLEEKLMAAFVCGFADSTSDMTEHVWYRILPAGVNALQAPASPTLSLPDEDLALRHEYFGALETALGWLRSTDPPDAKELGGIPISCSPTLNRHKQP